METLTQLARHLPIVLVVVGLLLVLLVLYIIFLLVRSSPQLNETTAPPPSSDPPPQPDRAPAPVALRAKSSIDLRRSFRRTIRLLRRQLNSRDAARRLPFYLVLGTAGSEDADLWDSVDLNLPFGPPLEDSHQSDRCNFWIYDGGVVTDLGGDYVQRLDGSADEKGLQLALRLLQRYRPTRPLDGVLVPISARELLSSRSLEGFSALEQRADALYRSLWQVQKQLGMLFPVYVVITGSEGIAGLTELARNLPESLQGEMLGWSNPYHLDQTYRSEWIEEAFQMLGRDLRAVQKEAFVQGLRAQEAEGLLLLPSRVADLEEPVRRYLDRLFKPTAYHEPIQLRGVYLCARDRESRRTFFLRDLLQRKAFSELALARPAMRAMVARQRLLSIVQWSTIALMLILVAGTARAYFRLEGGRDVLESFFHDSLQDLHALRRLDAAKERPTRQQITLWSNRLLGSINRIRINHFASLWFPQSWTGQVNSEVNRSFDRVFEDIVFKAVDRDLNDRALRLTAESLAAPEPERLIDPRFFEHQQNEGEAIPPDQSLEIVELRSYLEELGLLERNAMLFNELSTSGDLQEFAVVVDFALGIKLDDDFFTHTGLIKNVLRNQRNHVDLGQYAKRAKSKSAALTEKLLRHAQNCELCLGLEGLAYKLDNIDSQSYGRSRTAGYQAILENIRWVENELTKPGHEWMFRDRFQLGGAFDQVLAAAQSSSLIGVEGATAISQESEMVWIELRRRLVAAQSRYTGNLLQIQQGAPRMALSGDVQLLKLALEGFLGQGFMKDDSSLEPRPFSPGQRIQWDIGALNHAIELYEPYERFRSRGLEAFPPDLRAPLDQVARQNLTDGMAALVAQAQSFRPEGSPSYAILFEQELRAATANLSLAAPLLEKLQTTFGSLDQWDRQQTLQLLMAQQSGALLSELDEMVDREQPYRIQNGDFSWWQGQNPVGFRPYGKTSLAETTRYLDTQRRRLQQLTAEIGQPLAGFLGKSGFHQQATYRTLFDRWEGIGSALAAYEAQKPGGTIEALEKYVLTELPAVNLQSCTLEAPVPTHAEDLFTAKLAEIQRTLNQRCGELRGELAASRWKVIESFFNQRLAGRYPFAAESAANSTAALADDVRTFYRHFDESLTLMRATRYDRGPLAPIAPEIAAFLDSLEKARPFFAPFLDAKVRTSEPFYDLDVEMRVNRGREVCGEQIIEWVLDLAGQTLDQRSSGKTLRWQPGQKLEFRLRWAKDAPALPAPAENRSGYFVDGPWATWRFADHWALLHLLESLQAEAKDFDSFEDPAPHTLLLRAPLLPTAAADKESPPPILAGVSEKSCPADADETRVFVRLRVLAPETKELLTRRPFPTAAPKLEKSAAAETGRTPAKVKDEAKEMS